MIELQNIEVIFNRGNILETHALKNISLYIKQGEFITLIGSNGAGKSTLLGAIAGSVSPNSGAILINGRAVTALSEHQRATQIARVMQNPLVGTCPLLSIEENMALASKRSGRRGLGVAITAQKRQLFRDRLACLNLNLENRLSDPVAKLSGGQRQALSLVMATLSQSRVLLLDEHTAALDPRMAKLILDLTVQFATEFNLTVLMITHSMQTALNMGNRTIMMHGGKIAFDVGGDAKAAMSVSSLIEQFNQNTQDSIDDDKLLLKA